MRIKKLSQSADAGKLLLIFFPFRNLSWNWRHVFENFLGFAVPIANRYAIQMDAPICKPVRYKRILDVVNLNRNNAPSTKLHSFDSCNLPCSHHHSC